MRGSEPVSRPDRTVGLVVIMSRSDLRVERYARRCGQFGRKLWPGRSRRCQPQHVADTHQLAQVITDGMERPLACGALVLVQTELAGVVANLHLSKAGSTITLRLT
jgi:hypothetical protein